MRISKRDAVKVEIDRLGAAFFRVVSFEAGGFTADASIAPRFIDRGLLIKHSTEVAEVSSVQAFIEPREALVASGFLTRFHESRQVARQAGRI